jgi:uncharacterized protein
MKRRDFLKGAVVGAGLLGSGMLPGRAKADDWGKRKRGVDFSRIDSYSHFAPIDYMDTLDQLNKPAPSNASQRAIFAHNPSMTTVQDRINMMDECGIDVSILVPSPFLEAYALVYPNPVKALQAAQFINNEMAGIVSQHPDRFKWVALLPTNLPSTLANVDIMLQEFTRAITNNDRSLASTAVGACFVVSPTAKPPDHDDYMQLYAKAVELGVPLWMHPARGATYLDYPAQYYPPYPPPQTCPLPVQIAKYYMFMLLGWILDTSVAMTTIAFSGVFDRLSNLKIICHHKGAITALFQNRLTYGYLIDQANQAASDGDNAAKALIMGNMPPSTLQPYVEQFKNFYVDTAFSGNESFETDIVKIAYNFFGANHMLFGTDAPLSPNSGRDGTLNARYSIEQLQVTNKELENIFSNNILNIIPT